MKKIITLLFSIIIGVAALSADENLFSVSAGISSGVPFYGSKDLIYKMENFSDKTSRAIVGALGSVNLNIAEPVTFFVGTDFLADFNWSPEKRCHVMDLDFSTGLKIYPGIGGLSAGIAYVLGYSVDYYGIRGRGEKTYRTPTPWGNGFKLLLEYNFAHSGNSHFLPTVGTYWKVMPRGNNNVDNHLCAYVCANF